MTMDMGCGSGGGNGGGNGGNGGGIGGVVISDDWGWVGGG